MLFRRPDFMREMVGQPQSRGFMWGVGTAVAAYFLWPAVREVVRPATRGVIRGAMVAGDRFRYAMSNAREGIEDVVAEAQFERMREAVGAQAEHAAESAVSAVHPREH